MILYFRTENGWMKQNYLDLDEFENIIQATISADYDFFAFEIVNDRKVLYATNVLID